MNEITNPININFDFNGANLRVVDINGELWFVAADVLRTLDIQDHGQALERLDEDERGGCTVPTPLKNQHGEFGTVDRLRSQPI